jgi:hypothetical protein
MGRSIRISLKCARMLLDWLGDQRANPALQPYLDELRAGLGDNPEHPIRNVAQKFFGASRRPSKEEKRDVTASIREACLQRAGGKCECGCGVPAVDWDKGYSFPEAKAELDHFAGRGKVKQSVETCWILRANCHREKTDSRPDAATWLRKFIAHCDRLIAAGESRYCETGNMASRRLRFAETRSTLPAAPRLFNE